MAFTKVHAGRLLTLAWYLKTAVPKERFDMSSFIGLSFNVEPAVDLVEDVRHYCGTTACALGWCVVVFPKRFTYAREYLREVGDDKSSIRVLRPGTEFFGISTSEWRQLFSGVHHRTPKQEAKVIENFVFSKGYTYA